MRSFFKKATIVLLVIILVPMIAYKAWSNMQNSLDTIISLKCNTNETDKADYLRIRKKRKSDTPDFLIINHHGLFLSELNLKELTAEYADYQLEIPLLSEGISRSEEVDKIIRIHRETLTITTFDDGKEVSKHECEEISESEIIKVVRENFAVAFKDTKSPTKDRKF